MTDDLFSAALDARDRRIARLERQLDAARAEVEALQVEIDRRMAGIIVTGQPVAVFPSARRIEYIDRAVDQINRLNRPEAREKLIRQRTEETVARLVRKGISEEAAHQDAAELERVLRARTGLPVDIGGRGA